MSAPAPRYAPHPRPSVSRRCFNLNELRVGEVDVDPWRVAAADTALCRCRPHLPVLTRPILLLPFDCKCPRVPLPRKV